MSRKWSDEIERQLQPTEHTLRRLVTGPVCEELKKATVDIKSNCDDAFTSTSSMVAKNQIDRAQQLLSKDLSDQNDKRLREAGQHAIHLIERLVSRLVGVAVKVLKEEHREAQSLAHALRLEECDDIRTVQIIRSKAPYLATLLDPERPHLILSDQKKAIAEVPDLCQALSHGSIPDITITDIASLDAAVRKQRMRMRPGLLLSVLEMWHQTTSISSKLRGAETLPDIVRDAERQREASRRSLYNHPDVVHLPDDVRADIEAFGAKRLRGVQSSGGSRRPIAASRVDGQDDYLVVNKESN